jgi:hypothetical protein
MESQRSSGGFLRGMLLFVIIGVYLLGLAIWTPLFLIWPRRYAGMTFRETVATRWVLVRHVWTRLVRNSP